MASDLPGTTGEYPAGKLQQPWRAVAAHHRRCVRAKAQPPSQESSNQSGRSLTYTLGSSVGPPVPAVIRNRMTTSRPHPTLRNGNIGKCDLDGCSRYNHAIVAAILMSDKPQAATVAEVLHVMDASQVNKHDL